MEIARTWFDFTGRLNRKRYWIVSIVNTLIGGIAIVAGILAQSWPMVVVAALICIPLLVSSFAAGIKRLHDRDKPAWWLIVFYVVPSILQWIAGSVAALALGFGLVAFAVTAWGFVELGCIRGTIGGNRYGPDPIAPKLAHH